jgi:hypothetical protein
MKTVIEIVLALVVAWCGGNWLMIAYWYYSGQLLDSEFTAKNEQAFMHGLCFILALGFLGLML